MILSAFCLVVGAVMVLWGADRLTDAACAVARRFGISEMVIGLTIVSMGTSLPEFCISLAGVVAGSSDISVGNIVGSNLFNVLVIVGLSAVVAPISVARGTLAKDIPFALLAGVVFCIMVCADAVFDRSDGLLLLCFFMVFMWYTFSISKPSAGDAQPDAVVVSGPPLWRVALLGLCGLAALVGGGQLFVDGASSIALALGVSELVVGLTIVAAGTSLPELATSVVAARKGASGLAIGNVIGSNLFNVFFVLGLSSSLVPTPAGGLSVLELCLLVGSVLMMWSFSFTRRRIERWEGAVMLLTYIVYTCITVATNTNT